MKNFRVLVVGTEFFCNSGGIQAVNRLLWLSLADFARHTPSRISVLSYGDDSAAPLAPEYAAAGFDWHAAGRSRGGMTVKLATELRRVKPHVVLLTHVQLLRFAPLFDLVAPGALRTVLGHGIEVWDPIPEFERRALVRCASVVAPSQFTRQRLIEANGVAPERVQVIPHGLPPRWNPQSEFAGTDVPVERDTHMLLSVTRMNRADIYKGIDVVLRAMPAILQRCPDAHYHVVGDGDDRPRLEALAQQLGVARAVQFHGEVRDADLHRFYRSAAVFVLPSQKEGFGIVFAEAMFHRLPVVAARAAGAVDVIEDGVTGILVPPDSPEPLASAVSGLLLLEDERRAIGEAGRRRVEAHYLFPQFSRRWQRWLAGVAPEPVYLARHVAVFGGSVQSARPARIA